MGRIRLQCDQCFEHFDIESSPKKSKCKCPGCGAINQIEDVSSSPRAPAGRGTGRRSDQSDSGARRTGRRKQPGQARKKATSEGIPWQIVLPIGAAAVLFLSLIGGVIYFFATRSPSQDVASSGVELKSKVTLDGMSSNVVAMTFSPDGAQFVCGTNDGQLQFWKTGDKTPTASIKADARAVVGVAWSPDGQLIAVAGQASVNLLDAATRQVVAELPVPAERGRIQSLAFSGDQKYLAGAGGGVLSPVGGDPAFAVWEVASRTRISDAWAQKPAGRCLAFAPQGTLLAIGGGGLSSDFGSSGNIILFDVATGAVAGTLRTPSGGGYVGAIAFSPDGRLLATGTVDTEPLVAGVKGLDANQSEITVWDVETKSSGCILKGHFKQHQSLIFADNNHIIAAGGNPFPTMKSGGVVVLSLTDCKVDSEPYQGQIQSQCVAYSRQAKALAWSVADILDKPREPGQVQMIPWWR